MDHRVAWLLFFTRCDVFCDLLQYTHTRENVIYSFYTIKIQMVYWRILGAWKKKNKSADVIWRGFDAICVCVCPLIDHGQQPMKTHTEVTLLHKELYAILSSIRRNFYVLITSQKKHRISALFYLPSTSRYSVENKQNWSWTSCRSRSE